MKMLFAMAVSIAVPAATLVPVLSSERNDYNPSTDARERFLVFARSDADFANARIMVSQRQGRTWAEPRPISFSDSRYSDSDPWLTLDGRTLYFVSNRPTASRPEKTDLDIWRSHRTSTGWSAPEHLGDGVNSTGPELGPELHAGVLTFAAVRKGGQGGLDIYRARERRGRFGPPTPLPGPFNSKQSDSDFTLSADGRLAAFWRGGSDGTASIYISRRTRSDWSWSQPVPLGPEINLGPFNFTPSFAASGHKLWFASTAQHGGQPKGMADIYVASLPPVPK
jgi:hypothetical protein